MGASEPLEGSTGQKAGSMLVMKSEEYRAMLEAVERALEICRESLGKMDAPHRKICDDLRDARDRLLELLDVPPRSETL